MSELADRYVESGTFPRKEHARALVDVSESPRCENPELVVVGIHDNNFKGPYASLMRGMHLNFVAQAASSEDTRYVVLVKSSGIAHGFNVIGRILSWSTDAYKHYSLERSEAPQPTTLGAILHNSMPTVDQLAGMEGADNTTYEKNFGLLRYGPVYERLPFLIAEDSKGDLSLQLSRLTLQKTVVDIYNDKINKSENSNRRCPAIGKVMRGIWSEAIEACVVDPQLFPAYLADGTKSTYDDLDRLCTVRP